ncbi:MAG: protoporphyrinogen oxidase [Planctomycetes bacterium]|nr:protoporphyrinogen oxidase [Planctomycetota bacterium]
MSKIHDVAVVGAGLAGLTAANLAQQQSLSTIVFEKSDRIGGKALTKLEHGFVVELGPLGWLNREPRLLQLLQNLGVDPVSAADAQANRYLLHQNKLAPLPTGPVAFMLTPLMSMGGRIRFVTEWARRTRKDGGDESVHDFATRRFGRQAAETLFEAFVSGVFAGDPRQLSVQAAFPLFTKFERDHGSIMAGGFAHMRKLRAAKKQIQPGSLEARYKRGNLLTMPDGIGGLAQVLAAPLQQQLRLAEFPDAIEYQEQEKTWLLKSGGTELARAKRLLMACPAVPAAQLLTNTCPELAAAAAAIPGASLAVVTVAFKRENAVGNVDGFGFLAARKEGFRPLGVQFAHSIFPSQTPAGFVQLRVMLGGTLDPEAIHLDDEHLLHEAVQPLRSLLGLKGEPEHSWIARWQDVVPQYTLGHLDRIAHFNTAEKQFPGLHFLGDSYHGVGVPAAVARAHDVVASW